MSAGEQPNMLLDLTATIAAHSVLQPLCLLRMSAAQQRVGLASKRYSVSRRSPAFAPLTTKVARR